MSESDGEQAARSVALEQAYVHEVYEQCAEKTAQSRHWPRIYQFLEELEPGALVCDIGCGNGKYLSVNHSIFKVGVDRCKRLTDIAREKENEVLICDNLALPFRDESFDAVLSIAVVHHFATTERRVHALKELARVLRIGGRLVISVWAMEQRHRKFESQDVLVPWPKAYCPNSTTAGSGYSHYNYNNERQRDQGGMNHLNSKRNSQRKCRNKYYWTDPIFSPSPSTSSLSSPNETCYSFFRRALQKLAGGKRGNRAWFLETWQNGNHKNRKNLEHDDSADIDELPIELRRLEDTNILLNKRQQQQRQQQHQTSDSVSVKSKSLGDILDIQRLDLVRSRSSIPGLCSTLTSEVDLDDSKTSSLSGSKPRLVKQKSHFDDGCLEIPQTTAIQELIKDLPDFQISPCPSKRGSVHKQSSLNEELMSLERLKEKEHVRRNILKQASLNEEIICNRTTFESFKDSIYSGNATKRFQLLKSGLTNKIKQSTTNIEKVSGMSIKNGFVRILQGWKAGDNQMPVDPSCDVTNSNVNSTTSVTTATGTTTTTTGKNATNNEKIQLVPMTKNNESIERRLSREDGSDSSKDSSLQSDTSVDSEDSFASVIYVPKQDAVPSSLVDVVTAPSHYQLSTTSAPPSPRVKYPPDLQGPRLKFISISPLFKQFPATSKSLPPPSPPGLSPRTVNSLLRPFFQHPIPPPPPLVNPNSNNRSEVVPKIPILPGKSEEQDDVIKTLDMKMQHSRGYRTMSEIIDEPVDELEETAPLITEFEDTQVPEKSIPDNKSDSNSSEEENRKVRLHQIKELLKQKPGFATRTKPTFPLVRRASTATSTGRLETMTKALPRLLSLELFNPETDDLDSDSSGVSSPESGGSVISVISDERYTLKKEGLVPDEEDAGSKLDEKSQETTSTSKNPSDGDEDSATDLTSTTMSSQSSRLLEAAASVASSLEDAVGQAITQSTAEPNHEDVGNSSDKSTRELPVDRLEMLPPPEETTWNEECRRHLIDFTEKLSENLIHDIDEYRERGHEEFDENYLVDRSTLSSKKRRELFRSKSEAARTHKNDAYLFHSTTMATPASALLTSDRCTYSELANTIEWINKSPIGNEDNDDDDVDDDDDKDENNDDYLENDNKPSYSNNEKLGSECSNADLGRKNVMNNAIIHRSTIDDIIDFVMVSDTGEFIKEKESEKKLSTQQENQASQQRQLSNEKISLRFHNSIESSDIGDSIENTISISDGLSQAESIATTGRLCSGSTASLISASNLECNTRSSGNINNIINNNNNNNNSKDKRKFLNNKRSASEEIPSRIHFNGTNSNKKDHSECLDSNRMSNDTLSGSSSQESLPSDRGGGAMTYHQYYHVFREGELDQLINKYVENLHIISSYYDHSSWCIVAEKVQVWTI